MISKDLFFTEGRLNLSTRRYEKMAGLLYIIFAPLVVAAIFFLLKIFTNLFSRITSIPFFIFLLAMIYFIVSYVNMVMKIARNNKSRVFDKDNEKVSINGKLLCRKDELRSVIIQPSAGVGGFGTSYTVGLEYEKNGEKVLNAIPLSFFHVRDEARDIAKHLCNFYGLQSSMKRSYFFSFFRRF
jgi:hypothetical protein